MVDINFYRKSALAFPDTVELPHFNNPSFRINNRIIGTYHSSENRAMLFLPLVEQSVFCSYDPAVFYPVPGAWGKQGATYVDLSLVRRDMFKDALKIAYHFVLEKSVKKKLKIKSKGKTVSRVRKK